MPKRITVASRWHVVPKIAEATASRVAPSADAPALEELALFCPICRGDMPRAVGRAEYSTWLCIDCGTSLIVPTTAWDTAKRKGE